MRHIFASFKGKEELYHLLSDPDFHRASALLRLLIGLYPEARLDLVESVPIKWTKTKLSALDFAKVYAQHTLVIDIRKARQ